MKPLTPIAKLKQCEKHKCIYVGSICRMCGREESQRLKDSVKGWLSKLGGMK